MASWQEEGSSSEKDTYITQPVSFEDTPVVYTGTEAVN